MRIRKIISLLIVFLLLASSFGVYADNDNLNAIGITNNLLSGEADGFISRAEFAYLVSKMMTGVDMQPTKTKFVDVNEKNVYSGYVAFLKSQGIINGVSETEYAPDLNVTKTAAAKIISKVLGYNIDGTNVNDYLFAAEQLGIFNDVYVNGEYITRKDAFKILENALVAINGNKSTSVIVEGDIVNIPKDEDDNIYLTTQLSYSVYRGAVKSINKKKSSMVFYVEKNEYETNNDILPIKKEVTLNVLPNIDLELYDKVPATVWTNKNGEVTLIRPRNGYNVRYGYVEYVNGDNELKANYLSSSLERISIVDDAAEYEFSDGAEIYYNDKKTTSSIDLSECFVRIVEKNGNITHAFFYKTEKGGLIKNISTAEKQISYVKDELGIRKWNEAKDKEDVMVFIDGRKATLNEIKSGSVFNYYLSDKKCIIVVAERIAVDVFDSFSSKEIKLGAFSYKTDNCYFSKDGVTYKKGEIAYELLKGEVTAYFSPNGKIAFVEAANEDSKLERFYGIVSGVDAPKGLEDSSAIELYVVGGENVRKEIYKLTEKTVYKDNLSVSILANNAKDTNGEGIYYFTVNSKGEIKEVEKCTAFTGYGEEAKVTLSRFINEATPVVTMPNGKQLYFQGTKMIGVFEQNGDFAVADINWLSVYGRGIGGEATLEFFSKEETPQPDIALLCGPIGNITESENVYGVVTKKGVTLKDSGEAVDVVEIMASNGTRTYNVSKETADRLEVNSFVSFAKRLTNDENQIIISEVIDMSSGIDDWKISLSQSSGMQRGVVRKIDSKRLYLEADSSDDVFFMHPYSCFILASYPDKNEKFTSATVADIDVGDKVCYYLVGGEIRVIIVEK